MKRKREFFLATILAISGFAPAKAGGDAVRGSEIAAAQCARCHVVSEATRFSGISSTLSFMGIVKYLPDWEERFSTFYVRRPHPVHVRIEGIAPLNDLPSNAAIIELRLEDVEDIVEYARSLLTD